MNMSKRKPKLPAVSPPSKSDENWKAIKRANAGDKMFKLYKEYSNPKPPRKKGRPRSKNPVPDPRLRNPFFVENENVQ
jgi:hypothetical protein